jgi:hypothetical protein
MCHSAALQRFGTIVCGGLTKFSRESNKRKGHPLLAHRIAGGERPADRAVIITER